MRRKHGQRSRVRRLAENTEAVTLKALGSAHRSARVRLSRGSRQPRQFPVGVVECQRCEPQQRLDVLCRGAQLNKGRYVSLPRRLQRRNTA